MSNSIPIIDVFAGPGGLGEGFSALRRETGESFFKIGLSVEKDPYAHSTLELRSFFRQFPPLKVPEDYYAYIRGDLLRDELFEKHPNQAEKAKEEAWLAALGSGQDFDDELDRRIVRAIGANDKWVLIGGPPCQAYSIIGRARINKENDERNYLYIEYLRIIAKHKPAIFVMENVKGILSSKIQGHRIFDQILSDLENPTAAFLQYKDKRPCRYKMHSLVKRIDPDNNEYNNLKPEDFIVECEKYGIPQARHRVVIVGVREDLSSSLEMLSPEPVIAIEDIIGELPRLRSGFSKEQDSPARWRQQLRESVSEPWIESVRTEIHPHLSDFILKMLSRLRCPLDDRGSEYIKCDAPVCDELKWWYEDDNLKGICNHTSRSHMRNDIYRYAFAASYARFFNKSPKLNEFPRKLQPDHKNANSGHFDDRFRVQLYGHPSTTITSHISKDGHYYIHPDPSQARSLTVREAARLQTFPDNYFFCGNRTQQYTQVGNAVPPLLAFKIAKVVSNLLETN